MIYVCRVDTGSRHIFDFADGIENVGSLANAIENQFRIEKSKQILLISGGEVLDDYQRKFFGFGFGCEESPIYLIDKTNVEKREPPCVQTPLDNINSEDAIKEINAAIMLKPSFQTLQTRSQLTCRINELNKNVNKLCQSLYDEQFWQYQGYLALIANLDDYISSFRKKEQTVREQFDYFFNHVNSYKNTMKNMNKYMNVLSKTRLLPSLLNDQQTDSEANNIKLNESISQAKNQTPIKANRLLKNNKSTNLFSSISSQSINNLTILNETQDDQKRVLENLDEDVSLLDWIKSTDPNNKLDYVVNETKDMLDNFEKNLKWNELDLKINDLLNQVESNSQLREIEGLTKRLEDLKGFIDESNRLLLAQNEITDGLKSNFERAASLRDESVLKDLCKTHATQLEIFKQNHLKMIEIAIRIRRAKVELIKVIHLRLQRIMQVQKNIADFDFQIQIYFKQLRRLNVRLKLMEQLKKAPYIYVYSMKESVRRKEFTKSYKLFAKYLGELLNKIYDNELNQRKLFTTKTSSLSQNFILNILFRSLNDKFEPNLAELKTDFDDKLPQIDEYEINEIENEIINYLKTDQSSSIASPSSSTSESCTFSSQTSPSESDTSSSSNTSTFQVNSSINFENETFLLKELQIDLENVPKVKVNRNKSNQYLNKLKRLTDFMVNSNEPENEQSQKTFFTLTTNNEELKETVHELKQKLSQTKQMVSNYQEQVTQMITKLLEYNQQLKNIESKRQDLYPKILTEIDKCLNENVSSNGIDGASQEDQQFVYELTQKILNFKKEQDMKITKTRQSMNAENQIKFNEAIKRVVTEKDKQIEDLRQKQTQNVDRMTALELEIDQLKLKLASQNLGEHEIDTNKTTDELLNCDQNETKSKLKELMLQEKINQLQKQLSMFHTLPLTNNFYETIQLNSCNLDDVVLAVYSEEHGSYRVIHKTSNYLHFVYSAVFKNYEQKLSIKVNSMNKMCGVNTSEYSTSPPNDQPDIVQLNETIQNDEQSMQHQENLQQISSSIHSDSTIVNDTDNIFAGFKQPQWFVGKVLVKEFCVARKENNRFKVPSGTRFFRVKLKPYNLL